jgi:uncharacterized membrane protein
LSIPLSCPVVNRYPFLLPPLLLKDLLIGSQSSTARSSFWVLQLEPKPVSTLILTLTLTLILILILILNVMLIRFILNQNHRQASNHANKIFPKVSKSRLEFMP